MPVYVSSNWGEPENYVADKLFKRFKRLNRADRTNGLEKKRIVYRFSQPNSSWSYLWKSRFKDQKIVISPKQALHIFAENSPVSTNNVSMLN